MFKPTKSIRRIGERCRIAIPREIRERLGMKKEYQYLMWVEDKLLFLTQDDCILCGSPDTKINYRNKKICNSCLNAICRETYTNVGID